MKPLITPVSPQRLVAELSKDYFIRHTQRGNNEVYVITHHQAPNVMREIGRLREWTFRDSGGGTGEALDIDEHDTKKNGYQQLIVWNPLSKEIVGAYRFAKGSETAIATMDVYQLSDAFQQNYQEHVLDLGRAFIRPDYQAKASQAKGMFSLDNLWDGLGAIISLDSNIKYLLGRIVTFPKKDKLIRDLTLYFLEKHFPDPDKLIRPDQDVAYHHDGLLLDDYFKEKEAKKNIKILIKMAAERNEQVSPLIYAYMKLSPTMRSFGTVVDNAFGGVEETCIMVKVADIFSPFIQRYVESFRLEKSHGSVPAM